MTGLSFLKRFAWVLLLQVFLWGSSWADDESFVLAMAPLTPSEVNRHFVDNLENVVRTAIVRSEYRQVSIVKLPVKRLRLMANNGAIDGIFPATRMVQRYLPNLRRVDEALAVAELVAGSVTNDVVVESWDDLANLRVAYPMGWLMLDPYRSRFGSALAMSNLEKLTDILSLGRVDAIIHVRSMLEKHNQAARQPIRLSRTLATEEAFLYLHERHAALAPDLVRILRMMKASGQYQSLCPDCLRDISPDPEPGQ